MKHLKQFAILVFVSAFLSCKQSTEPATGIRIVPGFSVDGITLGMNRAEVQQKIGIANSWVSADGNSSSWYGEIYQNEKYAGLTIWYVEIQDPSAPYPNPGPVDVIEMGKNYSGKTFFLYGIGSRLNDIRSYYGAPYKTKYQSNGSVESDIYCFNGVKFYFYYVHDIVERMLFNDFSRPNPDSCCCKKN